MITKTQIFENHEINRCKHTKLRLVKDDDAEFILSLRRNKNLNNFLSPVDNDITKQREWLSRYKEREKNRTEFYFIITSLDNVLLGTVRLYDFKGDSFSWGSWIVSQTAPTYTAIESALLIYEFAFFQLGFKYSHFDVRKENVRVVKFHNSFGAQVVSSNTCNFYFKISQNDYIKARKKYHKFFE